MEPDHPPQTATKALQAALAESYRVDREAAAAEARTRINDGTKDYQARLDRINAISAKPRLLTEDVIELLEWQFPDSGIAKEAVIRLRTLDRALQVATHDLCLAKVCISAYPGAVPAAQENLHTTTP